jgi:hypothetical protein
LPAALFIHACSRAFSDAVAAKLIMPGLVPGIHVLPAWHHEGRGWPGQRPAMTKMRNNFENKRAYAAPRVS